MFVGVWYDSSFITENFNYIYSDLVLQQQQRLETSGFLWRSKSISVQSFWRSTSIGAKFVFSVEKVESVVGFEEVVSNTSNFSVKGEGEL